ncbi:MAG TPA: diguanylate cyclase [Spirochaetia bacterium]|nr:diguanylate cyclase [Spirochaetia bacterium]
MNDDKTILIVDDTRSFALAAADMVDGEGYDVHLAFSAAEALAEAERVRPRVVFLDVVLPDGEGYEVCSALKRAFMNKPLQVVMMSGVYDAERMDRLLATGADDFIKKPFEALEFQLRLKAAHIRLQAQLKLMEEREYYRQAVRQEENLTIKLLDRQLGLKETLADLESKKTGLERENTRLAAAARFDVLTGLLNRHSLNARLELEARKADAEDARLSGLMVDVDRFKAVNDSYGHLVGDEALRAVGDALRACLRKEDFAGRYGGDEFFVILPGSGVEAALAIGERIRATVAAAEISLGGARVRVSASVGAAERRKGDSAADWVGRADAAMYRAKKAGRDRVMS